MTGLRLVVPASLVAEVLAPLRSFGFVTNVVHLPGAAIEPEGDVVLADVASEEVSFVVERLTDLGLDRAGSIAIDRVDASVSLVARRAMANAPGSAADAVLWEQVEQNVRESSELSASFLLFMGRPPARDQPRRDRRCGGRDARRRALAPPAAGRLSAIAERPVS